MAVDLLVLVTLVLVLNEFVEIVDVVLVTDATGSCAVGLLDPLQLKGVGFGLTTEIAFRDPTLDICRPNGGFEAEADPACVVDGV